MTAARRSINPWRWQEQYGFVQAQEVTGAERVLYCAGQAAIDADGTPQHPGDMRAQLTLAFDNLKTVLRAGGFELSDVVRHTYYTTDMDAYFEVADVGEHRLAGKPPAVTLLGVSRLAFPELLIEIEATAVA